MRLFEVKLRNGKKGYLFDGRWKHIVREHPTMMNSLLRVEETVMNPMESYVDEKEVVVYLRYYKDAPIVTKYLTVIVKYLNGEGLLLQPFTQREGNNESKDAPIL